MSRLLAASILAATLATGCIVHSHRRPVVVAATTPDLVVISPGVQVIADYDEPIFFADGYYWWYVDGFWYRSSMYTTGWVYVASPPVVIVRIGEPHRYRHYRPHGYVVRHRPVPAREIRRPATRDHRNPRPVERPRQRDHR